MSHLTKIKDFINNQCYFGYYNDFSFLQLILFLSQLLFTCALGNFIFVFTCWEIGSFTIRFLLITAIILIVSAYLNKKYPPTNS